DGGWRGPHSHQGTAAPPRRLFTLTQPPQRAANGVDMSVLLEKRSNGVAIVTLDRPQVLNALDVPAKERLASIWREIADDAGVRRAGLAGAGAKAFCPGSGIQR